MNQNTLHQTRFAHSLKGSLDETKWEPLGAHLRAVAARGAEFGAPFGLARWAEAAGLLHDIGKNADAFQAYIRGRAPSPDHSTAGAKEAEQKVWPAGWTALAFCHRRASSTLLG